MNRLLAILLLAIVILNSNICSSYQPRFNSKYFRFKESNIHYTFENKPPSTSSTISNNNSQKILEEKPVLLFIPGFGVGSFHFESNIESLSHDYNVFCVDLLGQGLSWPDDPNQKDLQYSSDLWADQIIYMIKNVIQQPVHIAGNSLGGYLSLIVASKHPELIKSLNLLNPTPFWAFQDSTNWLWDGSLPAPKLALTFGSIWFNLLRNPATVKTMLSGVYYNPNACDDTLVNNIIKSASFKGGPEAFTSIAFAPKHALSFDELITAVPNSIDMNLIMGGKDPWIVPYWAQRVKRLRPSAVYLELDKSGHCPNHETPTTTNALLDYLISSWEMKDESKVKGGGTGDNNRNNNCNNDKYKRCSVMNEYEQSDNNNLLECIQQFLMEKKEVQFEAIRESSSSSSSSGSDVISKLIFHESSFDKSGHGGQAHTQGEKVGVSVRNGNPRNLFEYIGSWLDGTRR